MIKPWLLLVALFLSAPSAAADEDALASMIKAHAGKNTAELQGVKRDFTLRLRPASDPMRISRYDHAERALVIPHAINPVDGEWIYERCQPDEAGTPSRTRQGKRRGLKLSCERLEVFDAGTVPVSFGASACHQQPAHGAGTPEAALAPCTGAKPGLIIIPMAFDAFQQLRRSGLAYEIGFEAGAGVVDEVFVDKRYVFAAGADNATEKHVRVLTAHGRVKSLSIIHPTADKVLASFER